MHVDITHTDQGYRLTFTLRKDKSGDANEEGRLLALTGFVQIPKDDLEDRLLAVRKTLLEITLWPCYDSGVECSDFYKFTQGTQELIKLGSDLWTKIFNYDVTGSLYKIGEWLKKHPLAHGAIIQVSHAWIRS